MCNTFALEVLHTKCTEMTLHQRIRMLRGNTSKAEFCRRFGIHRNTLPKYESGERAPGADFLKALSDAYDVSLDWLIKGTEPMRPGHPAQGRSLLADDFEFIPMAEAKLSAGGGAFVLSESMRDYYAFRTDWLTKTLSSVKNAILMRVTGDSMEPTIYDGDTVMLDTGRTHIYDGSIYALRMEDTIMIKRLSLRPGNKIQVIPDNRKEYDAYETDRKDIHVLAQVVWFARVLVRQES